MRTLLPLLVLLAACKPSTPVTTPVESDTDTDTDTDTDADTDVDIELEEGVYRFPSRADGSVDSVSYDGQVFRHLLIDDMKGHIGGLTDRLNTGFTPAAGDVADELLFYLEFDSASTGTLEHGLALSLPAVQQTYDDVSSDKDLFGKIAGNDPIGQHKDWSTEMAGWSGATSPEGLVRDWVATLDAQAVDWSLGIYPQTPDGVPVDAVYLTEEGHDLQQLLEKFLRGAIAFSQGTDDYLDDDTQGKGLLADHSAVMDGAPYTELEHQWDEGFGYFGAARTYGAWSDLEISERAVDVDGDDALDLLSEVSWGHSVNAGKRDLGSNTPTDFTAEAWMAFYQGRLLLASTDGALTPDQLDTLRGHRDDAVEAWEKAIATTVVHYINAVLADHASDASFTDLAKHWSELKGFALGLQFNPHSPLTDAQLTDLHDAIGMSPVVVDPTERASHLAALRSARTMLGTAYGLPTENLGDDDGANGW